MISRLLYFGATHKTAALAVREQFTASPDRIVALLDQLKDVASERLVLSTCGRFELYVVQWPSQQLDAHEQFTEVLGLSSTLCRHFEVLAGEAAARRALRVAAGLESRIVGEHQVLGQVRHAFDQARLANATGPIFSALFRSAIHTGKRVRSETAINRASLSFAEQAVDLVRGELHSFVGRKVAIIGTGAMARAVAASVASEPHDKLIIVSSHADRRNHLAAEFGVYSCAMDAMPDVLAESDALICCASSRWGVMEFSLARRTATKPLLIVDLGVPRNVDPSVGRLPGVHLFDLDGIPGAVETDQTAVLDAEKIVEQELNRLLKWIRYREAAPRVARLARSGGGLKGPALHRAILQLKEEAAA